MVFEPPERLVRALDEDRRDAATPTDGAAVAGWFERLPTLLRQAVEARGLTVQRVHAPGGRSSLVVLVRRADGGPAVLKLAPPQAGPAEERAALAHWDGRGAVRLLDAPDGPDRAEDGALLLERLRPDVSLRALPESRAMLEAADALRRLWTEPPAGHGFETVAERTGRQALAMQRAADAFGDAEVRALVEAALDAHRALLAEPPPALLLHGAFRQSKVLAGERMPWLAVGPEPVIGESAFDLATLVRDRVEDLIASPSGELTTRRRVKRLAEALEVDRDRLAGWTLFRAVAAGVRARRVGRHQDAEVLLEFASWL